MLHPSVRLILWAAVIVFAQVSPLAIVSGVTAALALLAALSARERVARLMRRAVWLLIPLVVLFAFFTPGTLLLPQLGAAGPTFEGARLALLHGLRLVAVIFAAAMLLEHTGRDDLVAGLYTLLAPLRMLGMDPTHLTVRVMLVLRYIETPVGLDWRDGLEYGVMPPGEEVRMLTVSCRRLQAVDYLILASVPAVLFGLHYT